MEEKQTAEGMVEMEEGGRGEEDSDDLGEFSDEGNR